jgi:superfamily II DNA or RNA helicase
MDATIDLVGLVRPTQSLTLHLQQIGRALRPKPHKAVILDHAGNLLEHGLPDEDRLWSLDGMKRSKSQLKTCPQCQAINPFKAVLCEACGHDFRKPVAERGPRNGPDHVEGDLVELDATVLAGRKRDELRACRSRQDFADYAKRWGYKPGWVWHAWRGYQEGQRRGQERVEQQAAAYLRR